MRATSPKKNGLNLLQLSVAVGVVGLVLAMLPQKIGIPAFFVVEAFLIIVLVWLLGRDAVTWLRKK